MMVLVRIATAWLFICLLTSVSQAESRPPVELLMFERAGCPWCLRWEREIEPIYAKTDFGKIVPLRKINLDRGTPPDLALEMPVRFTPSFIVVREGREVGRITGYVNDAMFWGLLETIHNQTQPK